MEHPLLEEPDWFYVIAVVVVGEKEASNYVGMKVRLGQGNMQIASNIPLEFRTTVQGWGRLALMDGDFVKFLHIDIGNVLRNGSVTVLN